MNPNERRVFQDWETFVAVAEAGGITAAARRLSVSKAAVSATITRMEADLGVRLFQRSSRRVSLTEAGSAALSHAKRAVGAVRDAAESARSGLESPRGLLRLTAPMSFGLLHVTPVVSAFLAAYPDIQVDLALDDHPLDLVQGGFDLALRIGQLPDSALVAQRLAEVSGVLVAHPRYLDQRGRPTDPTGLAEHDALVYTLSPTGTRWPLRCGAREEQVPVRPRLRATNSLALRRAALDGLGIARLPLFTVAEDLAAGALEEVLPEWDMPSVGLFALTVARAGAPRKTSVFVDFFRAHLGSAPAWNQRRARANG